MEKHIEAKLKKGVEAKGGLLLKWNSSGTAGVPDRIGFLPGSYVFLIETKFGKNGLSVKQKYVQKLLRNLGIIVYNIKTDQEVKDFLETI